MKQTASSNLTNSAQVFYDGLIELYFLLIYYATCWWCLSSTKNSSSVYMLIVGFMIMIEIVFLVCWRVGMKMKMRIVMAVITIMKKNVWRLELRRLNRIVIAFIFVCLMTSVQDNINTYARLLTMPFCSFLIGFSGGYKFVLGAFVMLCGVSAMQINMLIQRQTLNGLIPIGELMLAVVVIGSLLAVLLLLHGRVIDQFLELDVMLHHLPGITWIMDTKLNVVCCRGRGLSIYSAEQNDGFSMSVHFDRNYQKLKAKYRDHHIRALSGDPVQYLHETSDPETSTRSLFQHTLSPLKDSNGDIIGLVGLSQDVTELAREKEERHTSEETYKSLVESVDEIILKVDLQMNIEFMNKDFLDRSSHNYIGCYVLDLFSFDESLQQSVLHMLSELYSTAKPQYVEWHMDGEKEDSTTRYFSCRVAPIMGSDQRITAGIMIITETTEYQRAIDQEKLANEMKIASKSKSEFLASMSHEIRNPLNGILGSLQLLSCSNPLTDVQIEHISDANDNATLLLAILSDILDMSKIESGRLELVQEEASLLDIVETVGNMIASQAHAKSLSVYTDIDTNLPEKLVCDRHRISQILLNFASNSIKFTNHGFVLLSVKLFNDMDDSCEVYFECKDSGIGIREQDKEKIFQPFVQVSERQVQDQKGWGLGLQICYRLANLMHGSVGVDSVPSVGSTFYFKVTLSKVKSSSLNSHHLPTYLDSRICDMYAPTIFKKVLIAAYDKILINILRKYLKMLRTDVTLVSNIEDALQIINNRKRKERLAVIACVSFLDHLKQYASKNCRIVMLVQEYPTNAKQNPCIVNIRMPIKVRRLECALRANQNECETDSSPDPSPIIQVGSPNMLWPDNIEEANKYCQSLDILVVEDNDLNRKILSYMLKKIGIKQIDLAINGQEALDRVKTRENPYSIIFMDLLMPVMCGTESTQEIRKLDNIAKRDTPIVALTGNVDSETMEECRQNSFNDVLTKPVSIEQLFTMIKLFAKPASFS